jgi:hypothetical protein
MDETKVRVRATGSAIPQFSTVELPGYGAFVFFDGEAVLGEDIARRMIAEGLCTEVPDSAIISIPSVVVAHTSPMPSAVKK